MPAPFFSLNLLYWLVVNLWEFYISGIIRKQLIVLEVRENICRIMDFLMIHLIGVFGIYSFTSFGPTNKLPQPLAEQILAFVLTLRALWTMDQVLRNKRIMIT